MVTGSASNLNLILSYNKVFLVTMKQTSLFADRKDYCNDAEYKRVIFYNLCELTLIVCFLNTSATSLDICQLTITEFLSFK